MLTPSLTPSLTPPEITPQQQVLARALQSAGQVDQVVIDIVPGGFVWRLTRGGVEVYESVSSADQIAPMLRATEIIMNTELGIERPQLCQPALN